MHVAFAPAFLLHRRPYRESSALVELLTREHGRVSGVLRLGGARRKGGGSICRPFTPLHVSWQGQRELKTLTAVEATGMPWQLEGERLYGGFYLNELLVRLLPPLDPHPELFSHYALAVAQLAAGAELEPVLRRFESGLLDALGYGLDFSCGGQPLDPSGHYRFDPRLGFSPALAGDAGAVAGELWLCLAEERWEAREDARRLLKWLSRLRLQPLLGPRPLQSRALWASSRGRPGAD